MKLEQQEQGHKHSEQALSIEVDTKQVWQGGLSFHHFLYTPVVVCSVELNLRDLVV